MQRFVREMYSLSAEPGPLANMTLNNTRLDYAWNLGLYVSAFILLMIVIVYICDPEQAHVSVLQGDSPACLCCT